MTVAFNHKHMTVMYMESKLNGSEMVALRVSRNATLLSFNFQRDSG